MNDRELETDAGPTWTARLAALLLIMLVLIGICSCSTPEKKLKAREAYLAKFAAGVAKHLLDRNPITVRESMNQLFRGELSDAVIEKLRKQRQLPKTELGILKIITESEETRTTNLVEVTKVHPLGPVNKDIVPFRVTGKITTKTEGKPDRSQNFTVTISCKLSKETAGYPLVVDLSGPVIEGQAPPVKSGKPRAKRGRRR